MKTGSDCNSGCSLPTRLDMALDIERVGIGAIVKHAKTDVLALIVDTGPREYGRDVVAARPSDSVLNPRSEEECVPRGPDDYVFQTIGDGELSDWLVLEWGYEDWILVE